MSRARHQRSNIRSAIKERLTNETPADDRIFLNRSTPLWELEELPAILVFTPNWTDRVYNQSPPIFEQTVEVRVIVAVPVASRDDVIDELDDIYSDAIERQLLNDDRLGGAASGIMPIGGQQEFITDTAKKIASLTLVYEVSFQYQRPDKEVTAGLDNLATVSNRYRIGRGQSEADQTKDLIQGLDQ